MSKCTSETLSLSLPYSMHGQRFRHRNHHGGDHGPSRPQKPQGSIPNLNPNPYFQSPNLFVQSATFVPVNQYPTNPYFSFQNPSASVPIHKISAPDSVPDQISSQQTQFPPMRPEISIERIDRAVVKARGELIAAGENVSARTVSQSALIRLEAESWDSLGVPMQQVPSLHRLIVTEGKINAFIHCFVAVQRITTLHDLDVAICKNEGIEQYEELELGPLVRHPLVIHYFSVSFDAKDIFKITSEEIISCLCEFIDIHKGSRIDTEEFLAFVATKKSISGREKLNARIQSLGMHITFIRQARRLENNTLKKCLKDMKQNSNQRLIERPLLSSQKRKLDEHFRCISKRIESFSSANEDFGGKHIRFVSSSSEETDSEQAEDKNRNNGDSQSLCNILSQSTGISNQPGGCPYPSAAEERSRLGLKMCMNIDSSPATDWVERNGLSEGKRKPERIGNRAPRKVPKTDENGPDTKIKNKKGFRDEREVISLDEAYFSLDNNSIKMFIMMWKEASQVNSVSEVFLRMLQFYNVGKLRRKAKDWFSSHPFIGLLNVAVMSIARGMWDSVYDDCQVFADLGVADVLSEKGTLYERIEVEPVVKDAVVTVKSDSKLVTVDNIVRKVSAYFELEHKFFSNTELTIDAKLSFLRKLYRCELWLAKQFSVEKFKCLGYGKFFVFLEKHVSLLYNAVQKCFTGEPFNKSTLKAYMLEQQLAVLLSQAAISLGEGKTITKEIVSPLLTRQFPLVSFGLAEGGFQKDFIDEVKKKGSNSTCVLFSVTLLGGQGRDTMGEKDPTVTGVNETINIYGAKTFHSINNDDAIKVLLRAPMLTDLLSWTHWDIVFAPSLGPLVEWLLNEVNTKELLCLVTRDGKVIRIDTKASIDSFFEACLQGSSFQAAVELLSILSLYGGEMHVPSSLLKCHTRQALDVLMKNSRELAQQNSLEEPISGMGTTKSGFSLHRRNSTDHREVKVVSRFFICCLHHLPREFHAFAADILLSGLQFVLNDAPSVILGECKQIDHRLLLHDVGLSLGIVEWIDDFHSFSSSVTNDLQIPPSTSCFGFVSPGSGEGSVPTKGELTELTPAKHRRLDSVELDRSNEESDSKKCKMACDSGIEEVSGSHQNEFDKENEALLVIESIRREEFGLDPELSDIETSMLKKQHARLGRALHCLSQELYSQDSHFLLELVQNADDNVYPEKVEPTLTFILQESEIVVLNNECGFSSQNIRALCDVGSSTKKGATGGYIGKKGIGFKSVFRVTDAPEIHSNGFHVKFDITEGQIGFVLPTIVPACDVDYYSKLASCDSNETDSSFWNTCIVLPFRKKLSEDSSMNIIRLMFCDLHPSLLLFLHRLQCIRFRSIPDDTVVVMRKEIFGNGIVNVSYGKEKMTWFVASQVLQADVIRPDVHTTEISIAFTLQESGNGEYVPHLEQQPVFAFLPLRRYGLKFILQGDFVLPSSREEVDGDSPWNQWLLAKFPDLFASAEKSFCAYPSFRENPGRAVSFFMSFVPLVGEVQGFFSSLPRLIISKLRMSKCLLLEGDREHWVLPCKVMRNWNEEAQSLLLGSNIHEHLSLGFLDRNIVLSDPLARDLGVQEYGPTILVQVMASLCRSEKGVKSAGLVWLSSWLNALYTMLFNSSGQILLSSGTESDVVNNLKKIPFIPLSDGAYSSVDEGTIWLQSNHLNPGFSKDNCPDAFPVLFAKLRILSPALFSAAATVDVSGSGMSIVDNITRMLLRIGVQQLSAHEIVKVHILPAITDEKITLDDKVMMVEYLSFAKFHLQSSCPYCHVERGDIVSDLRKRAFILTNYGFRRPADVAIHFSQKFGNPIDVNKLIDGMDLIWHEVGADYLQHLITEQLPIDMRQWREFFQQIGVTDFVHVVSVEKSICGSSNANLKNIFWDGEWIPGDAVLKDWESRELVHLLSQLSLSKDRIRSCYLLEALDMLWDDNFIDKIAGHCIFNHAGDSRAFKSSFINCLCDSQWIASSADDELHYARDLFYDCDTVRSILGAGAPYAFPKVKSEKLLSDIGFKTQVTLDDVLTVLRVWRKSGMPFMASLTQMSKFYTFIWNEMATTKQKILDELNLGPFIFIPYSCGLRHDDVTLGMLFTPSEVHWRDFTGSVEQIKDICHRHGSTSINNPLCKTLCSIYPSLHAFFVNECGVREIPHYRSYLQILLELSAVSLPSQTAKMVFQVFLQWGDGLRSGSLTSDDVIYMKECLLKPEFAVLPTLLDKWVSLHPSFGLLCWCDDDKLKKEFKHLENIDFLYFGELSVDEQELLRAKVSVILQTLGIPSLSEVVTREAIYYGLSDSSVKTSLLNWAFPYAQRYIYATYLDRYVELKKSGFEFLNQLQIVVVEKLFFRNVIKGSSISSKKRVECDCLLQGNLLYATQESDSHSLFMELSCLFYGVPNLHLANFLHMIKTMAELGSNEDQMEFFILHSQKVPKIPESEPMWSLRSSGEDEGTLQTTHDPKNVIDQNPSYQKRKPGTSSNWPPVDWKTAPGFGSAHASSSKMHSTVPPQESPTDKKTVKADREFPSETETNCAIEFDPNAVTAVVVLPDSHTLEDGNNVVDSTDIDTQSDGHKLGAFFSSGSRDNFSNAPQALLTGKLGEQIAYNYFSAKAGKGMVTWVNRDMESGLPYDLVIDGEEKSPEYIEVKATRSSKKDWFHITVREWQFAVEKGECFSIAHVVLSGNDMSSITVFKNPVELCHLGKLQLAALMPRRLQEFSIS